MSATSFDLPEIDTLSDLLPAFEFEYLIAQGGMGAVYKARQRSLDRDVAIKILPRELGDDPQFRSSFEDEAKAMARLTHPNLIKVYDSGDLDGMLYIVMEYVPGKSLFHSAFRKAIDPKQAVEIVIAACHGLAHAHDNGIIHRDIKPGNILLTPKCEPKIGDFGLARCTRANADGLAMGTPGYMAPEILDRPEKGDPQSDVYAIGVVLRELLTGISAVSEDAKKSVISDLKLSVICRKATHADPASRYPDASSFADQLTRWMAAKPASAAAPVRQASFHRPVSVRHANPQKSSVWTLLKNCAVITFLLCAIHLTWSVYQKKEETFARQQQEQEAKPLVRVEKAESKPADRSISSQDVAMTTPEPSVESFERFGPALAAGNFE